MRYRVLDLPVQGVGAFTPLSATNPIASSWGLVKVTADLGASNPQSAPSPAKSWMPVPGNPGLAHLQDSNNSPDVTTRSMYVTYPNNMGPMADAGIGMATRRRNPIPVPAVSWIRSARKAMPAPKIGGRRVPAWPRAFQRWPVIGGRTNG